MQLLAVAGKPKFAGCSLVEGAMADRSSRRKLELFVNGARKARLPDCVPADNLKDMPNLIRVKSCDEQRTKITG